MWGTDANRSRTCASSATSTWTAAMPGPTRLLASSSRWASRPAIVTSAPRSWAILAVASPMPELPPITTTRAPPRGVPTEKRIPNLPSGSGALEPWLPVGPGNRGYPLRCEPVPSFVSWSPAPVWQRGEGLLLIHFDHFRPGFGDECWEENKHLRRECPVAYSDTYGGFWVLSKYDDVKAVALDDGTFSSAQSVTVPAKPPGARLSIPIEMDPPRFNEYRRALNPWFTPTAARRWEPTIRRFANELIDGFSTRGSCDLVTDFTNPLPAMSTLAMLGLDPAQWETYAVPIHAKTFLRPDKTKTPEFAEVYAECHRRIRAEIESRRTEPRPDMLTALVDIEVAGRPISDDELQDIVMLILHGGFDTTGSAISNAMIHMNDHHALRDRLRANPGLLPTAVEEFLRFQAPQPGLARVATADCVIRDQRIKEGDRLLLLWGSANRDEAAFDNPDEVVPDRHPNRHLTFGIGLHRCVGAPFASAQIRVALAAVLRRIPDYEIDVGGIIAAETNGTVVGHFSIPMTFTPENQQ